MSRNELLTPYQLHLLLGLVDRDVSEAAIANWSEAEREAATRWAAKAYLLASDNIVRVPPEPECVKQKARGAA